MKIILNIGTHGDEKIGLKVAQEIKKLELFNAKLTVNIANKKAFRLNRRFIDTDLNRCFPGKKNGSYEEKLAYKLLPKIKAADLVIDIHSTKSGIKDTLIVTHFSKKIADYAEAINPKYVLCMNATKKCALISFAKAGIAFEFGADNSKRAIQKTVEGIKRLFKHLNIIKDNVSFSKCITEYFNVFKSIPKYDSLKLHSSIKNFELVKSGKVYALNNESEVIAKIDFYPILFGQNNYESIFGFAGKKIKIPARRYKRGSAN